MISAEVHHLSTPELEANLAHIRQAPRDDGTVEMIVCRPAIGSREVLAEGKLDVEEGLVGDNWRTRGSSLTEDRSAHPEMQLNIMNARVITLLAQNRERWPLAGDQLYVDMDLSTKNLPPGTRLAVGSAVIEVTAIPHNGCKKFRERFGLNAIKFVNSPVGKELHLRGINARVVESGIVRAGDTVRKVGEA